MIIKPKIRGFIATTAHPTGCAENVRRQIEYTQSQPKQESKIKTVLVIGGSTGYGLASRIVSSFRYGADTMSVFFERMPTENKTASPGYYNSCAFQKFARDNGFIAESVNCDAFSNAGKQQVIDAIKQHFNKPIDLVIYSLASPRRTDPKTGATYKSVLKPIGEAVTSKTLNTDSGQVSNITLEPATESEIDATVKVMGGEDWQLWIDALQSEKLLADNCQTVSYTYLGKSITWPIYGQATIGKAKEDLERAANAINHQYSNVSAKIAVLKGLVTQASSAIPVMPLYISLLYKVMKDNGTHEGCIEQINRLFSECLYHTDPRVDTAGRLRVDNLELEDAVQNKVIALWDNVNTENLQELSDFQGYMDEFYNLFGFGFDNVNYENDVDPVTQL